MSGHFLPPIGNRQFNAEEQNAGSKCWTASSNHRINGRPRPGRRKASFFFSARCSTPRISYPTFLHILFCMLVWTAQATRVAELNGLLYDPNPLQKPESPLQAHLFPRAKPSSTSSTLPSQATLTLLTSTGAAAATVDPSAATPTALPQPFDSSLGNNFTSSSCPAFFRSFLNDATFKQCYPLSLLLQVSQRDQSCPHRCNCLLRPRPPLLSLRLRSPFSEPPKLWTHHAGSTSPSAHRLWLA
jgi:hypothetical protein